MDYERGEIISRFESLPGGSSRSSRGLCKYASDTDYRGTVMEGPLKVEETIFDGLDDEQQTNA